MKKTLLALGAIFALAIIGQVAFAAAFPPGLGGTGTTAVPSSGQTLIGNGAGTYTPALLTPGTDIIIQNASGSVTISVKTSDFLPSSTVYVATVNGQSGAVTITSSTLGVATNTLSLFNGNGFTTTTIQSVLNALSVSGLLTYNSSTGVFGYTSSSLALGSASHYNFSDFLPSSTIYVTSVNGQSGAVAFGIPATTTINNTQAAVFKIVGDGTTVTSTVIGTSTTFSIINTGNWAGSWQGVNSTTFYLASNPNGFISSAPATSSINGVVGPTFTFTFVATSSQPSITTSSAQIFLNFLKYNSSTDITITTTGTIVFANHNVSQFTNDAGYGTSNVSTSTPNTWSQQQTFNGNLTTPSGTISNLTAATEFIQIVNSSTYNIPPNFGTAGCFGSSTVTDLGGCANYAYLLANGVSSTKITVPTLPAFTQYSTGIAFNTNGEYADLECSPGQVLQYVPVAGTSTPAINYNEGWTTTGRHITHDGGHNCVFAGGPVTASTATSTGIVIGGTNGESQLALYNMGAINFGIGWETATNTYMLAIYNPLMRGNVTNWQSNTASNSGEDLALFGGSCLDPGNNSSSNSFVLQNYSTPSFNWYDPDIDDCGAYIGQGILSANFWGGHGENPARQTYGAYDFFTIANDPQTHVTINGMQLMHDSTGTANPNEYIMNGANLKLDGVTFTGNNGSSTPFAVTETGSTYSLQASDIQNETTTAGGYAFTTLDNANTGGIPTYLFVKALAGWTNGVALASDTISGVAVGTGEANFQTAYTIPANLLTTGKTLVLSVALQNVATTTQPNHGIRVELRQAGVVTTTIYASHSGVLCSAVNTTCNQGFVLDITALNGPSANASITTACVSCNGGNSGSMNLLQNGTAQPVSAATNAPLILQIGQVLSAGNETTSLIYYSVEAIN